MAAIASGLLLGISTSAQATPVATNDVAYQAFGRAFPDPHGCTNGAPGTSPWAKGNVCAVQYLQWGDTLDGLDFLEQRFDRYLDVLSGEELRAVAPNLSNEELQSAGLPREDLTRAHRDLQVIKVTDSASAVEEAERKHFVYVLSIHGIERAGVEGGVRAIEDLVTWSACEADAAAAPACATDGPFPKPIMETEGPDSTEPNPSAGHVLENAVIYFVLANPDGWQRGEWSQGGVFFQRYNGNGMDLNRDWATVGYTDEVYTPASEPETRGYAKFLRALRDRTAADRFEGGIDLHGMLNARSFSFTLLGAGQRDLHKNELTVDTSIRTFRDSEKRLTWSPLIAPADRCPGTGNMPMCSDQWGTVWDTINYQITGGFGDWIESPIGLDGVGIDNEMALSHLAPNNAFDPGIEQLHIDGNKGLIYSQIASLLEPTQTTFEPTGRIGYVFDPERIQHAGGGEAQGGSGDLPPQEGFERTELNGEGVEFEVKGPDDGGVRNGGLTIESTFANARGVSPNALSVLILDRFGPEHPGDPEGWHEVARYFNQSGAYLQAGARIDLNDPLPGRYRIRASSARTLPTRHEISFSSGSAYPVPKQRAYDVSRMDFFTDLNKYVERGNEKLKALTVDEILSDPDGLRRFDTLVVANEFMPGADGYSDAQRQAYADALAGFARDGGNLTLTDAALAGLPALGTGISSRDVRGGVFYAGWMDFNDGEGPTYARHHLAEGVDKEGTAEGQDTVDGQRFQNRHQIYEPVPLGYYVSNRGSSNRGCTADRCDAPNWIVDEKAWKGAGGTTAARTLVRTRTTAGSPSKTGASLGEMKVGSGVIRIAGALLPDATEQNYHPFGLASYALTYTGYELVDNLLAYERERPGKASRAASGR